MSLKGKRILFIAPSSIPVDGPEAIVNIKQLEILSKAGCIIDVVSKKKKKFYYPFLNNGNLPFHLNSVHRVEVDNKVTWNTIMLHLLTFMTFGIVYKSAHWAWPALKKCKELIKENQYDFVMTKNLPSELLGYWIKKHKNIKWIATWNDPYPEEKYPVPYGKGVFAKVFLGARRLIPVMEKYPDFHLFPSNRLRDYMLQYLNIPVEKTLVIPHAVLDGDTPTTAQCESDVLSILHSGNVDYPRDPQPFLVALSRFLQERPDARLKVYFQGVYSEKISLWIKDLNLGNVVEILPPVSYWENMQNLSHYHVLLIIEAPCKEGIFLPTKVSDYMQAQKYIWAVSPSKGVLHDLYENGNIRYFSDCQDADGIYNELKQVYDDYLKDGLRGTKVPETYLSKSIVHCFESMVAKL